MNSLTWAVAQTPSGAHGGSVSRAHGRAVRQVFVGPSSCHGLQGANPTNPNRASVLHRTRICLEPAHPNGGADRRPLRQPRTHRKQK